VEVAQITFAEHTGEAPREPGRGQEAIIRLRLAGACT